MRVIRVSGVEGVSASEVLRSRYSPYGASVGAGVEDERGGGLSEVFARVVPAATLQRAGGSLSGLQRDTFAARDPGALPEQQVEERTPVTRS